MMTTNILTQTTSSLCALLNHIFLTSPSSFSYYTKIGNSPFADPHMDQVAICKNIVRGECFFEFEWLDRYGTMYFQSLQLIDRQNTFFSLHALLCPSIHILTPPHLPSLPSPSFLHYARYTLTLVIIISPHVQETWNLSVTSIQIVKTLWRSSWIRTSRVDWAT